MLIQCWLKGLFLKQFFSITLSSIYELNNSQLHGGIPLLFIPILQLRNTKVDRLTNFPQVTQLMMEELRGRPEVSTPRLQPLLSLL